MTRRAVLVGAGGIGRYHLLGLLRVPALSAVQVVEPDAAAAARAFEMAAGDAGRVSFVSDVAAAWPDADLTVVATQAEQRPALAAPGAA